MSLWTKTRDAAVFTSTGGAFGNFFGIGGLLNPAPEPPPVAAPPMILPGPLVPTIDDAVRNKEATEAARKRRGRAATIIAGRNKEDPQTATKVLLGE